MIFLLILKWKSTKQNDIMLQYAINWSKYTVPMAFSLVSLPLFRKCLSIQRFVFTKMENIRKISIKANWKHYIKVEQWFSFLDDWETYLLRFFFWDSAVFSDAKPISIRFNWHRTTKTSTVSYTLSLTKMCY